MKFPSFKSIYVFLFIAAFIMSPHSFIPADTVLMKTGEKIEGKILEQNENGVKIEVEYGTIVIQSTQIKDIEYDNPEIWHTAERFFKKREFDKALSVYRQCVDEHSDNKEKAGEWMYKSAICDIHLGLENDAVQLFRKTVDEHPGTEWALQSELRMAELKLMRGDVKEARIDFINLLEEYEDEDNSERMKQYVEAAKDEKNSVESYIKNLTEFDRIGALKWNYKNLAMYEPIIAECAETIKKYKVHILAILSQKLIYQCYDKQAEYAKRFDAIGKYSDMIALYINIDKAFDAIKSAADEFYNANEYPDAIKYYQLAIKKYPKSANVDYARYKIAGCYKSNKEYEKAFKVYEEFIRDYPRSKYTPYAMAESAFFYFRDRKFEAEILLLRKILQDYPEFSDCDWVQYNIIVCLIESKMYVEAREEYNVLAEKYPNSSYVENAKEYLKNSMK